MLKKKGVSVDEGALAVQEGGVSVEEGGVGVSVLGGVTVPSVKEGGVTIAAELGVLVTTKVGIAHKGELELGAGLE